MTKIVTMNPISPIPMYAIVRSYTEGPVPAYGVPGSSFPYGFPVTGDKAVVVATSASDPLVGVCTEVGANNPLTDPVDIIIGGQALCVAGVNGINQGDRITAGPMGEAVAASAKGSRTIGTALQSAPPHCLFMMVVRPGIVV